ncbi:MAG TPA: N-acetylmuramoyl-L-alanine amidase [Acidimicrobiia bacterium]|nr:N-acetylmuramoyl-L-alanine amidase [Acidimicrobiia bacterium]
MNLRVLLLILALSATGCSRGSDDKRAESSTSSSSVAESSTSATAGEGSTTTSSSAGTTVTTQGATSTTGMPVTTTGPSGRVAASGAFIAGSNGAAVASSPAGAVIRRIRAGVAMAVDATDRGWAHVVTPCENRLWVNIADGHIEKTADVVIDPGHGGPESGAVGPGGLKEKDLNFAVAQMTLEALKSEGFTVALARTGDYRQTLGSRVAVATAMDPKAFVSIHHNAAPDEHRASPGTETYYQTGKDVPAERRAASKRLAGLIYEEVFKALSAYQADWAADRDAGTKYRLGDSGNDYYGVLRISAIGGVVGTLAELAFVTNPTEETLLQRDDVRRVEAAAVARGIVRFLRTNDPGSGFIEPYPRTEPAGGGGGSEGCVDPT